MKIELSQSKRRTASLFGPFTLVKIKELPVGVRDLFFPLRTQLEADRPVLPVVFSLPTPSITSGLG